MTQDDVEAALSMRYYKRRSGRTMIVIGRTADRYLFIVLRPSRVRPGFAEVVTARSATRSEKRLFARRGNRA